MEAYIEKIKKFGYALFPKDAQSLENIKKLKYNTAYKVKITEARNYKFLQKYMAMIAVGHKNTQLVYQENGETISVESYRFEMQKRAGFISIILDPKTNKLSEEKLSISFAKMDEDKFREVYEKVKQEVIYDIGITDREIENQIAIEF